MAAILIRDASPTWAKMLLPKARQVDIDEWVLGTGRAVEPTLMQAIKDSTTSRVALHGKTGEPFALWGVVPDTAAPRYGILWSIGTNDMSEAGRALQRYWKDEMPMLHGDLYDKIGAAVWERNKLHAKWLRSMGFKRLGPVKLAGAVDFALWERVAP